MHGVETFELVLALLGVVIAMHWVAGKLGIPPAAALLVSGGALAFIPGLPEISLDPELALVLFLPPLLMDGAFFTAFGRFRQHLVGIIGLALGAVFFTTLIVGVVVHWLIPGLPWAACFALGAIVAPPDAVAARAVLERVTLPRRLRALLEGESLLNDATGLVLVRFAVAATLSGTFDAAEAAGSFAFLALGGVGVGAIIGAVWVVIIKKLGDETLTIAASILLCWASYLAGEMLHVSGVIATVTAGIIFGWYQHVVFTAAVRLRGNAFWTTMVFCLEALVFILIGFSLRGVIERAGGVDQVLATMTVPVLGVVLAVTVARFLWVFGGEMVTGSLKRAGVRKARPLGWRQATVLSWAGMRGVVTLAVALTLPENMPSRDLMLVAAFGVILVTVIIQGTSLGWLIRMVKPKDMEPPAPMNMPQTEAAIFRARHEEVKKQAYDDAGELIHPQLLDMYRRRSEVVDRYAEEAEQRTPGINAHFAVVICAITAGRAELVRLHRAGQIEDEVLHDLERDLDLEELGAMFQQVDEQKDWTTGT